MVVVMVMAMAMGGATACDGIGIAGRSGQWLLGSEVFGHCSDEWGGTDEMGAKTDSDVMPSFNLSAPKPRHDL